LRWLDILVFVPPVILWWLFVSKMRIKEMKRENLSG
jgi:hypothetical protein